MKILVLPILHSHDAVKHLASAKLIIRRKQDIESEKSKNYI
jgi:hypothetical protein